MKRILLSLTLLSSFFGSAQTLLNENFEGTTFPPTGWTRSATVASRAWGLTNVSTTFPSSGTAAQTTYKINGTASAAIDYIAQNNVANLTSPVFSLATVTGPVLKFNVKVGWSYMIDQDAGDLLAQISTDGGITWTTLWDEDTEPGFVDDGDNDPDTDLYNTVAVQKSLAAYVGQSSVQIRFRYNANDADAVSVDDIQVLGSATLGTNDISKSSSSVAVYPNPTKGEINIKTDKKVKSTSVFDATGKFLSNSNSEKLDISSFAKGVYLIKVIFADGSTSTRKVIKQ